MAGDYFFRSNGLALLFTPWVELIVEKAGQIFVDMGQ